MKKWSREKVELSIKELVNILGYVPNWDKAWEIYSALVMASYRTHGGWRPAVEAAGYQYPGNQRWRTKLFRRMTKEEIKKEISSEVTPLHRAGIRALLKEKGFWKEASVRAVLQERGLLKEPEERICKRCDTIVSAPKIYCVRCARESTKEKTRARVKKFWANPRNRERYKRRRQQYEGNNGSR